MVLVLISTPSANAQAHQQDPTSSNFQPSLIVVIGVLTFMFSTTLILLIYAKYCHRPPSAIHLVDRHQPQHQREGMFGYSTRFSGVDKTIVESLPFFRFSNLKGAKQGLQCAVCLAEFGESEMLRLLPKCKHGFHIDCIDKWLEIHSTCPLCRRKVTIDDLSLFINSSSSTRFLGGIKSQETGDETSSNFEIVIEREEEEEEKEENHDHGSSKFSIGGSFRKILTPNKEEEMPMKHEQESTRALHRLNHQIIVSDVVFKNRWSNVSSSDLMFLNSEMLGAMSSDRFPSSNFLLGGKLLDYPPTDGHYEVMDVKEEMERKRMFEHKLGQLERCNSMSSSKNDNRVSHDSRQISLVRSTETRAMSEITAASRFKDTMSMKSKLRQGLEGPENDNHNNNDENGDFREGIKRRKLWFPIAKRTVQWFQNKRKNRSQLRLFWV